MPNSETTQHPDTGAQSSKPAIETALVLEFMGNRKEGFFLDVGANDPQNGSQTWVLEQQGWRGILVEPLPELCERLRQARPKSKVFQIACGPPGHAPELPFFV